MGKPHHQLHVWKRAISFVTQVYKATESFPAAERFGLVVQMRRSAVSIVSNISEGAGRNNKKEFNQFLGIAQGSAAELETQLIISRELGFMQQQSAEELICELDEISKMITGLQKSLKG